MSGMESLPRNLTSREHQQGSTVPPPFFRHTAHKKNGKIRPRIESAIRAFQKDQGLPIGGKVSRKLTNDLVIVAEDNGLIQRVDE